MNLTILNVAFPFSPVGPDAIDDAEQVLTALDAALVEAGHRSLVVACEDSRVRGELIVSGPCHETLSPELCTFVRLRHRETIEQALARFPVDVVHMHGADFHEYLPRTDVPVLVTLHLPLDYYSSSAFSDLPPNVHWRCVSRRQGHPPAPAMGELRVVGNGVHGGKLFARHAKRRMAAMVGRIRPEQGFHVCIDAARRAGVPLLIGGQALGFETHLRYFRDEFLPRLDRSRRWLGPLSFERKRRVLTAADCLLVPSLAPEAGSLIAMESLACGTPVIAFESAGLTEMIEPGVTGFLVHSEAEMAEAIRQAPRLDPEACRQVARERFSSDAMTRRYLDTYMELISTPVEPAEPPEIRCVA